MQKKDNYIETRSDRRKSIKKHTEKNKRQNIGRRKHERYSVIAYNTMLFILLAILTTMLIFIVI